MLFRRLALVVAVLAAAAAVAVPGVSGDTVWQDAVKAVTSLDAKANDAPATAHPRQLTNLVNYVSDANSDPPANIKDWIVKLREIRAAYYQAPSTDARPIAVVVGAGPMGLATALQLVLRPNAPYRVKIVEKTDGEDPRWNRLAPNGAFNDLLIQKLGMQAQVKIGALAEIMYVLSASLVAVGVDIKYNTMFKYSCYDGSFTKAHVVHIRKTPDDAASRYKIFTKDEVCNQVAEAGDLAPIKNVHVLVGATGTNGGVRRTMFGPDNEQFKRVRKLNGPFAAAGDGSDDPQVATNLKMVKLHPSGGADNTLPPVMMHIIVSFEPTATHSAESLHGAFTSDTVASTPASAEVLKRQLLTPIEVSDLPEDQKNLEENKPLAMNFHNFVTAVMAHPAVSWVDATGVERTRVYTEFMVRHSAARVMYEKYGAILKVQLMEDIVKVAKNDNTAFAGPNQAAHKKLARSLLANIHKLMRAGKPTDNGPLAEKANFLLLLEHIKVFGQQVRGAARAADLTGLDGLKLILVGDETRDSYYAHGNSVNSAMDAFVAHADALLATHPTNVAAKAAEQAYTNAVVTKFTDFIGADLYLRTYCGCRTTLANTKAALKYQRVKCKYDVPHSFKKPKSSSKQQCDALDFDSFPAAANCRLQSFRKFVSLASKYCDTA